MALIKASINSKFIVATSFVAFAMSACDTVKTAPERGSETVHAQAVMPVPKARSTSTTAGVLLAYDFESAKEVVGKSGCRWRVVNKDTNQSFFINLKAGGGSVFEPLTPGRYETGRFGCGLARVWDLDGVFKEGFRVEPGAVSYIGKLVFRFNGTKFDEVRKTQRAESAAAFAQAAQQAPQGPALISGFTLLPISTEMAQAASEGSAFEAFGQGLRDGGRSLDPLLLDLKTCETKNSAQDPLRLGKLDYTAKYGRGRFKEFKERKDDNAFSDAFRDCVVARMSDFRPSVQDDIEIRVRY